MELRVTCVVVLLVCATNVFSAIQSENDHNSISRGFDAKSMLSSIAGNLMSRGYAGLTGTTGSGTSQVVSLNLTNLVVLVLLKALIFAAGSLGAGTWKGGYGRSIDGEEKLFTDEELLLFLSYLTGKPGDNGCLQNIACLQPQQARKYAAAGKMLLKTTSTIYLHTDASYEHILQELQEAASWGSIGETVKGTHAELNTIKNKRIKCIS